MKNSQMSLPHFHNNEEEAHFRPLYEPRNCVPPRVDWRIQKYREMGQDMNTYLGSGNRKYQAAHQPISCNSPVSGILPQPENHFWFNDTAQNSLRSRLAAPAKHTRTLASHILAANWIWSAIALALGVAIGIALFAAMGLLN